MRSVEGFHFLSRLGLDMARPPAAPRSLLGGSSPLLMESLACCPECPSYPPGTPTALLRQRRCLSFQAPRRMSCMMPLHPLLPPPLAQDALVCGTNTAVLQAVSSLSVVARSPATRSHLLAPRKRGVQRKRRLVWPNASGGFPGRSPSAGVRSAARSAGLPST